MVQKQNEMLNGFWRIKWWRYRYAILAGILLNIFLINHFFLDQSISDLNPFPATQYPPPTVPRPKDADAPPAPSGVIVTPPKSSATYNLNDYNFNGQYVGWPLERLCGETKWQEGLVFVCDNNSGGIGNIRNFILTCIRYAIEAGATGITMPQIQRRSETDLANIFTTGFKPLNYFFDEEHFRSSIETYCPQMKIFNTKTDIPNAGKIQEITEFYPKDLNVDTDGCDGRGVNRHLDQFRQKFDQWIRDNKRPSSWEEPTTLRFRWATFFEWPIIRDGPEFAATFGDLLRINKDIEKIAVKTILELQKFAGVQPDGTLITAPYLGVHLRTESDALNFWPDFDTQSDGYIREADTRNMKHAYLASGNATDGHRFGIDHPYDTGFIAYPNNRTVTPIGDPIGDSPDVPATSANLTQYRAADFISVINALGKNATFAKQIPGVHGKLDVSKVGVLGHSLGGASAATAMALDSRFACGSNLDGAFWGNLTQISKAVTKPFLLVEANGHNRTSDASFAAFLDANPKGKYVLDVKNAKHATFTDLAYLSDVAKAAGIPVPEQDFGTIGGERMLVLLAKYLDVYFRKCLGGGDIKKGLEGVTGFPEVTLS
ncbi:putative Platelet-activating factor acetylhydrolase [Glarea lozoyensis 74030]|uniref:1-alkyl-2-acetylglycerophosphocholine esterase n=1 Tax=Glarea lozoyensis (strain ATCC 74030 / MF5533) TaxID=1104152 RepID=H0EFL5_GLAL7|nr:putative Platelet-activating factor acetylhydrolase [Glarea lozoyensis 74030]